MAKRAPDNAMTETYIAGDWGSSHLRLYLCAGGQVIDRKVGPGALAAESAHEESLFSLIEPWLAEHGAAPIWLCGMVGSRNGWVEAPYAVCPADIDGLRQGLVHFEARGLPIVVVPGLRGVSPRSAPDVMRGEETQIFGAFDDHPELARGRRLLVLPGTHTKWVLVEDGQIMTFQTAVTGELFALLRDHSSLALGGGVNGVERGGFAQGLDRQARSGSPGLLHELFEVRSRQLVEGWSAAFAMDFLSGMLIGADVAGALAAFDASGEAVVLIGDPLLTERYSQALAKFGVRARALTGEGCALAGLRAIISDRKDVA